MTVHIELPDDQTAALQARAAARGLTLEDWLRELASHELERAQPASPLETGYGMLAKYGPAPSAEEIDENRRDMFRGFGESF
jgi:plasmid stability protein